MKKFLLIGVIIAISIVLILVFKFIHPVLILTLGDIAYIITFDVILSFVLALYLGYDKGQERIMFWTIIGIIFPLAPIIASIIKYNRNKNKLNGN